MRIDLNCDTGEGVGNDAAIMPYVTSANIACGYHAGDETTARQTIELALKYNVRIGAHPSFMDRKNFGRKEMNVPADEVYKWVQEQINFLNNIVAAYGAKLHHVKPHGALYNMAARDPLLAKTIVQAVKHFDKNLVLFGLSGSCLISEAKAAGLQTASEVFADRTYQDDGSLIPRSQPNALIEDEDAAVQQVLQMVDEGSVTTVLGKRIPIVAETVCIHGDGKHAVAFAKRLHRELSEL